MASDLRCSFYFDLGPEDQAEVAATATELAAIPSQPAPPTEAEGGVPDIPPDDPEPAPITGILDDVGAPEPPAVFRAVNNYTGYLPDGREVRVWTGASGADPTLGEAMTLILTPDGNEIVSRKLVTAPTNDGPLAITGTTADATTVLLASTNGKAFRYEINGDHITPGGP